MIDLSFSADIRLPFEKKVLDKRTMGNTCASAHFLWSGKADDAVKAIGRAYGKLGYERAKKRPAEGGKRIVARAGEGNRFVSVYDSTNADIDSGELKDIAIAVSKLLKTGAVVTSLYDSDSYEFVVFSNGRQIDLLMTDAEADAGPLKRLSDKARAPQWGKIFGRPLTAEQIERAASTQTAFADETLTGLCGLIGLSGDRSQAHYTDFDRRPEGIAAELHFTKKPVLESAVADGQIAFRNFYDVDNSRKLLVYPAAYPMPVGREEILQWLILSEGAGFHGGVVVFEIEGPDGLDVTRLLAKGYKFRNGQIVGDLELATQQEVDAFAATKMGDVTRLDVAAGNVRSYTAELPPFLRIPAMTPVRTTQIVVQIQMLLTASMAGDWDVRTRFSPRSGTGYAFDLPRARVAAIEQSWLPVVSGLNPKTEYNTADVFEADAPVSEVVLDDTIQKRSRYSGEWSGISAAQARAKLIEEQSKSRERNHRVWLHSLHMAQQNIVNKRQIEAPSIVSNVSILPDAGLPTLVTCRSYLESWAARLRDSGGQFRLLAEKHMTETAHVGKIKKTLPAATLLDDKAWHKLFEADDTYQAIIVDYIPPGGEYPVAGFGLNCSQRDQHGDGDEARQMMALTLAKMRGRSFSDVALGRTIHLFDWSIHRPGGVTFFGLSDDETRTCLDAFASESEPLQAWHGRSTWIPRFDRADGYEDTVYEELSVLNFAAGILFASQFSLKQHRPTAQWCGNVLRMVTPHMWLCRNLIDQVDRAALERVAVVTELNGSFRIETRQGRAMDDLELALLPILPIESSRITVLEPV